MSELFKPGAGSVRDPHNLERFVRAQNPVYERVLSELRRGAKTSHWMWFIFPQLRGLGCSPMSVEYGISSREEASAYLKHPVLGLRLRECTGLVLRVNEGQMKEISIEDIFGSPDDTKFRSCMTLFSLCAPGEKTFEQALEKYFAGEPDRLTIGLLKQR